MKKFLVFWVLSMLLFQYADAQLQFSFVPDVYARKVDGLGNFQVQNLSANSYNGHVRILVQREKEKVVEIVTPVVNFTRGLTNFPRSSYMNSVFRFASGKSAAITNQTGSFPPGDYNICYQFIPTDKQADSEFENCFEVKIMPLLPLSLLLPYDSDTLCSTKPVLSWQPPMPYNAGMKFRLILTEKNSNGKVETLLKEAPLVLLDNISTTTINYPANYPPLKEGKTYCWQVVAFESGLIISTSEVWVFTVQCKEIPRQKINDSYRELKQLVNGNLYIANSSLKFSLNNVYGTKKLNYTIIDLGTGELIKQLPEIKLQQGFNKIDIDFTDIDLTEGKTYMLRVLPFNEPVLDLKFMYSEKEIVK